MFYMKTLFYVIIFIQVLKKDKYFSYMTSDFQASSLRGKKSDTSLVISCVTIQPFFYQPINPL